MRKNLYLYLYKGEKGRNKKLLLKKYFFIKGLHFGNKDDNIDTMKAAFVEIAREIAEDIGYGIVKKYEAIDRQHSLTSAAGQRTLAK